MRILAFVIWHATHMHHIILLSVACPALQIFFYILSQMAQLKKKVTEHKMCVLTSSTNSVCNISHSKKNLPRYYHK